MASITLTDTQWTALKNKAESNGAPVGGSVVLDITAGVLTVTWFPQANGGGTAVKTTKHGAGGQDN